MVVVAWQAELLTLLQIIMVDVVEEEMVMAEEQLIKQVKIQVYQI